MDPRAAGDAAITGESQMMGTKSCKECGVIFHIATARGKCPVCELRAYMHEKEGNRSGR